MSILTSLETWVAGWGYAGIFLVVLLGNLGAPLPEEAILLLSGYLAWQGQFSLPAVVLVGTLSAVFGDNLGYWLGRAAGRPLLLRYGRALFVSEPQVHRAERFFARYGGRAVFWGRFLAGVRFLVGPLAGIAAMPFGRFFTANALGAVAFVPLVTCLGYAAGSQVHAAVAILWRAQQFVLGGVYLLLLAWLGWRRWGRPAA